MANDVKDFGNYEVKSVKSFMGREGHGFNCTLYRNGKKIGECIDDASGGEMYPIHWVSGVDAREEQRLLNEHIKSLPKVQAHGMELTINEGWFVTELVTKWETERDIKKLQKKCATKTLFRHSKCKVGGYMIMSAICDEKMRAKLKADYGEDVEIFNDVIAEGKLPSVFQI